MSKNIIIANDATFSSEVLEAKLPVLVDFWATWCGPCQMLAPILEDLASEYAGKIKIVKVDVDQCPNVANTYGIRSIPTLIIFKNGQTVATKIGAGSKDQLAALINTNL